MSQDINKFNEDVQKAIEAGKQLSNEDWTEINKRIRETEFKTNSQREIVLLENGWYRCSWNKNFFTTKKLEALNTYFDETRAYIYFLEEQLNLPHI